jgi:hypothetical protein
MKSLALFLYILICLATIATAQNACQSICRSSFPATNQTGALNACYQRCVSGAQTAAKPVAPVQPISAWNMNAAQRQMIVQNVQVQQSSQAYAAAAYGETKAQMDQMQAQQQANVAGHDAMQAGLQSGMLQGQYNAAKTNFDKRIEMVRSVLNGPKAQNYSNRSTSVALADPFAEPDVKERGNNDINFHQTLAASCLEMGDMDHPAARVASCQLDTGCKTMPEVGLYPILPDGRFIDSNETLSLFLKACANPSIRLAAVNSDGAIVEAK